jgi:hypothetical protein
MLSGPYILVSSPGMDEGWGPPSSAPVGHATTTQYDRLSNPTTWSNPLYRKKLRGQIAIPS